MRLRANLDGQVLPTFWHYDAETHVWRAGDARYVLAFASMVGEWCVFHGKKVLFVTNTRALHPATVFWGEWNQRNLMDGTWTPSALHFTYADPLVSSCDAPLSLDLIGHDFFLRYRVHTPIWFVDPCTGKTEHSGAKKQKGMDYDLPGKRYCPMCGECFSANNFVSQHMHKVHPHEPLPGMHAVDLVRDTLEHIQGSDDRLMGICDVLDRTFCVRSSELFF